VKKSLILALAAFGFAGTAHAVPRPAAPTASYSDSGIVDVQFRRDRGFRRGPGFGGPIIVRPAVRCRTMPVVFRDRFGRVQVRLMRRCGFGRW